MGQWPPDFLSFPELKAEHDAAEQRFRQSPTGMKETAILALAMQGLHSEYHGEMERWDCNDTAQRWQDQRKGLKKRHPGLLLLFDRFRASAVSFGAVPAFSEAQGAVQWRIEYTELAGQLMRARVRKCWVEADVNPQARSETDEDWRELALEPDLPVKPQIKCLAGQRVCSFVRLRETGRQRHVLSDLESLAAGNMPVIVEHRLTPATCIPWTILLVPPEAPPTAVRQVLQGLARLWPRQRGSVKSYQRVLETILTQGPNGLNTTLAKDPAGHGSNVRKWLTTFSEMRSSANELRPGFKKRTKPNAYRFVRSRRKS